MKTEVKKIPSKGRGVFATDSIQKGELIEICELLLMPEEELPDSLESYVFEYNRATIAVALGHGSLYNHSSRPNCTFDFNFRKKVLVFKALRSIHKGEEITIDYGYTREEKKRFGIRD
jgi:SET domain-containing protein